MRRICSFVFCIGWSCGVDCGMWQCSRLLERGVGLGGDGRDRRGGGQVRQCAVGAVHDA